MGATRTGVENTGATQASVPPSKPRASTLGRRLGVLIGGCALIAVGIALMVLPGPGVVFILAGLALLATEFPAARRAQRWLTRKARRVYGRLVHGRDRGTPPSEGGTSTTLFPPAL